MKVEGLYYIYKITNPNGQIYIGKIDDFIQRFKHYKGLQCKGQRLLYSSIKHYGWENHKTEILTLCPKEKSDDNEIYYIELEKSYWYDNKEKGLNLTKGGIGVFKKGDSIQEIIGQKRKEPTCRYIPILQYSKDGKFIKEWASATIAGKELNIPPASIRIITKENINRTHAGGFIWRDKKDNNIILDLKDVKINQTAANGIFKVTNLITKEEEIFEGAKSVKDKYDLHKSFNAVMKNRNGISQSRDIRIELLEYSPLIGHKKKKLQIEILKDGI